MNKKLFLNAFIIFLLIIYLATIHAGAAVITVDSDGGEDYSSIQEAINDAQNGDTILVNPGIYQENVKVNKEVSIISNTASEEDNNRAHVLGEVPGNIFYVNSNNVIITGFYISGSSSSENSYKAGIYLEGVENCSLIDNALLLNDVGIALNDSQCNYINNNLVGIGYTGIILVNSGENELSDNWLGVNDEGILLKNSVNNNIKNNNVIANGIGIYLGISERNKLTSNLISRNDYGIIGAKAENNTIINNSLRLNEIGIYLNESSSNIFYQNEFENILDVRDEGTNVWNSSSAGNLWGDYTGKDANGDGIGDTPFVVNETTGSTDYKPLVDVISSDNS